MVSRTTTTLARGLLSCGFSAAFLRLFCWLADIKPLVAADIKLFGGFHRLHNPHPLSTHSAPLLLFAPSQLFAKVKPYFNTLWLPFMSWQLTYILSFFWSFSLKPNCLIKCFVVIFITLPSCPYHASITMMMIIIKIKMFHDVLRRKWTHSRPLLIRFVRWRTGWAPQSHRISTPQTRNNIIISLQWQFSAVYP